jgi:hypothetical protein
MSRATYPLKLPTSVKNAAQRLAKEDGVSLNQWIAVAVAQKVGVVETAADFFQAPGGWGYWGWDAGVPGECAGGSRRGMSWGGSAGPGPRP